MRTIRLQIAATETHCGSRTNDCQFSERNNSGCGAFAGLRMRLSGRWGYWHERLPECIAAEKEAGNGVKVSGDVSGNVSAGNSVTCQKVGGSIQAAVKVG